MGILSFAADQCIVPVLCCLCVRLHRTLFVKDNIGALENALEDLRAIRDGVLRRLVAEEGKGWEPLPVVARWLSKVQIIETDTNDLVGIASYGSGETVYEKLNEVKGLSDEGNFVEVAQPPLPFVVVLKPTQNTFGLAERRDQLLSLLMDDTTRIVGIYGMGGVGKTTLLSDINNQLFHVKDRFDVVIWIKVPKDGDVGKIQDDIGKRLGLYNESWCKMLHDEKAVDIQNVLTNRRNRFVLLVDDIWRKLSLSDIGIPLQAEENKYKIVFTTRSVAVCGNMGANVDIEVKCLGPADAWDLFKQEAREDKLNDKMRSLAEEVAGKCYGLPLALKVIGGSMSSRNTIAAWERAVRTLGSSSVVLSGDQKDMFRVLKLSYDNLEDGDAKLCFKYCALFPKASLIKTEELVEYWIGEGSIIDEENGRQRAKDRGYEIIDILVGDGLLFKDEEPNQKVYMHDTIREMALWTVTEEGERFVVETDGLLRQIPRLRDWSTVTKISMMNNAFDKIVDCSGFHNLDRLITLFLQNNKLLVGIVGKMIVSTLVVLDLSSNLGITELPKEISMSVLLRYLNLSGTMIEALPSNFNQLVKLIHLDLESTPNLESISLASNLPMLQVLRFYGSKASLDISLLKNLESLEYLELLTVTVDKATVLDVFLESTLAGFTHGIHLEGLNKSGVSFTTTFGALDCLSKLGMTDCNIIESGTEWEGNAPSTSSNALSTSSYQRNLSNIWFKNISDVVLLSCEGLKDLTWLIYAENLESLSITLLSDMEEIVSKEKVGHVDGVEPFLKLQVLHLDFLDELKSIYWCPLSFPSLRAVHITNCPKLKRLPFNCESKMKLENLCIRVEKIWLDGVEWEIGAREHFLQAVHTSFGVNM